MGQPRSRSKENKEKHQEPAVTNSGVRRGRDQKSGVDTEKPREEGSEQREVSRERTQMFRIKPEDTVLVTCCHT